MAVYTVKIERHASELGFSVKGGREHGVGILVSEVDPRGNAHHVLEVGDEILYVNGRRLLDVSHGEAVQILRSTGQELELTVQHNSTMQSALATSIEDYDKMKVEFERMREKIRGRPQAPVQAMQGAPAARPFPFPPFLTSRWTSSRDSDSVIPSPTEEKPGDAGRPSRDERDRPEGAQQLSSHHHQPGQVLPNMQAANVTEDGTGAAAHPDGLQPRKEMRPMAGKVPEVRKGSLPEGWSQRMDPRTRHFYYENHWLGLSFWTDPRPLPHVAAIREYTWSDLPLGWHQFTHKNGFVYYANHHNHTTHWQSPSLMRQGKLLTEVKTRYKELDERLQAEANTLQHKRDALLKNRDELQRLSRQREAAGEQQSTRSDSVTGSASGKNTAETTSSEHDLKHSLDGLLSAIIEEVMQLNDSVESLATQISAYQKGMSSLEVLRRRAQEELICGLDLSAESRKLSRQLFDAFMETVLLHRKKMTALHRLEDRRKKQRRRSSRLAGPSSLNSSLRTLERGTSFSDGECLSPDTSLLYMMQLPSARGRPPAADEPDGGNDDSGDSESEDQSDSDGVDVTLGADAREHEVARRLHVLADRLTVKCNLEMRVDIALLRQLSATSSSKLTLLNSWEDDVRQDSRRWPAVVERLSGLDDLFEATHFDWVILPFKEKLKNLTEA